MPEEVGETVVDADNLCLDDEQTEVLVNDDVIRDLTNALHVATQETVALPKGSQPGHMSTAELPARRAANWTAEEARGFLDREGLQEAGDPSTLVERAFRLSEALKTPELLSPDLTA